MVLHTEKGHAFGWVVRQPQNLILAQPEGDPAATMVRKGTASDFGRWQELKETEYDALKLARSKARELQLSMKIVATHYTFDRSRIIVTFGAEGRVDFRPLMRELGTVLRCRVELRLAGDRDVAKLAGGIGRCGGVLCCSAWMTKSLAISADGLAGACGRLRCCLRFEYEQYRQINRELPRIGEEVGTPNGMAAVIVGHRLKETVSVRYDDDQVLEWPVAEVSRSGPSKN